MNKLNRVLSYILVAVFSVAVTMGVMLSVFVPKVQAPQGMTKLELVERLLLERFIGEADQTKLEDAAANAMVVALGDRWSYYIPADEYSAYLEDMKNAYVGVGVTVTMTEDASGLDVTQVTEGGPAEEAGVLPEDKIVGVDGKSVAGMELADIKKLILGEAGTTVKLTLLRGNTQLELEITRREIKTVVATGQMLDDNIGLVTIKNFNSNCADETIAAIESLLDQNAEKLILDVRNNPGGYAHEMVEILNYLLPEGKLFTRVDYTGEEYTDMSDAACLDIPMAVLVNGNSYSAAEFFAAAMAEYDAAVVVGEKTTGKGYFQIAIPLSDGSAINLSVGKYYTPKGVSLAEIGVTPDCPVPVDEETAAGIYAGTVVPMEDPQILAAMEALK